MLNSAPSKNLSPKMATSFELSLVSLEEAQLEEAKLNAIKNKNANHEWKVGSSDEKKTETITRKSSNVSFSDLLLVSSFTEDGIIQTEEKNAFPFPIGTNPDVRTCFYAMDIEIDRETLGNFDVAAVMNEDPTTICVHFTRSAPERKREIETSFKIGFLIATTTPGRDAVCFVVWHADNEQISVINIDGTETHRGNLPMLPIGWIWCNATVQSDDVLTLQIYNPNSKEHSTLECHVLSL